MKDFLLLVFLSIVIKTTVLSCGCNGSMHPLEEDIETAEAIFIGKISEINLKNTFHVMDGFGRGLNYINFDILKIHKGIPPGQLKVTLFDFSSHSSCQGIHYGKEKGDTILVFAQNKENRFISSDLCGRHPNFKDLSEQELRFIDTARWNDPKAAYGDSIQYYLKKLDSEEEEIKEKDRPKIILHFSLILNLILFSFLIAKLKLRK